MGPAWEKAVNNVKPHKPEKRDPNKKPPNKPPWPGRGKKKL